MLGSMPCSWFPNHLLGATPRTDDNDNDNDTDTDTDSMFEGNSGHAISLAVAFGSLTLGLVAEQGKIPSSSGVLMIRVRGKVVSNG